MRKELSEFDFDVKNFDSLSGNPILQDIAAYQKELKFANASNLARSGNYQQAEKLISEILHAFGETPEVLDLKARIYAQQGRLAEAETIWRKNILLDPANIIYQEALQRISKINRRPLWLVPFFYLLTGFLLIFGLVAGTLVLVKYAKTENSSQLSDVSLNELKEKFTNLENSVQNPKKIGSSLLPQTLSLDIAGISTKTEGNELIINFEEGLFEKNVVLKPEAKKLLTTLGKQIEPNADQIFIRIYGLTDNVFMPEGEKYRDNLELGNARAITIFEHLRKTTKLLPDRILIGSFSEKSSPFPNDTPQNRSKNRSALLKIVKDNS